MGFGMPVSGPMDSLAFQVGNALVGNNLGTEGLEICMKGPKMLFHVPAVIAVTGAPVQVTANKENAVMWSALCIPGGTMVEIGVIQKQGSRAYLCIRGGFPHIPKYLGSKSTSMGLGGYQVRSSA